MDDELYREEILDHAQRSAYRGKLTCPCRCATLDNPLCGDRICLQLDVADDGCIRRARFEGQGCAISQASASMLAEHVEGKRVDELREFSPDEHLKLLGISLTPIRKRCGLLAYRALHHALASSPTAD